MGTNREYSFIIDNKKYWNEEALLAYLLDEELVFCNSRKYVSIDGKVMSCTTVIFMSCNDVFSWGTADVENIEPDEFHELYELHEENKIWGPTKWACKKRNLQPQVPIIKAMKKSGYWDKELESLPKNPMSCVTF